MIFVQFPLLLFWCMNVKQNNKKKQSDVNWKDRLVIQGVLIGLWWHWYEQPRFRWMCQQIMDGLEVGDLMILDHDWSDEGSTT